jgi:hypothetical protein
METRELAVVWGNRVTIWELGILSPENVLKVNREIRKWKRKKVRQRRVQNHPKGNRVEDAYLNSGESGSYRKML